MVRRSYFVKYSTTKKRTEISNFLPPVPITLFHSFFFQEKKKRKEEEKAGESLQYSGILSPGYSQSLPSLSCVYILRPRFPPCSGRGFPVLCGRGQRGGTGCPPAPGIASRFVLPRITGSPAETHPSGGGTQGGELATGCWKASQHRRTPWLLGDVAGWLAGSSI